MAYASLGDLIDGALAELQAINIGDPPTTAEYTHAIAKFNLMIEEWASERYLPIVISSESFALASGNQTRTIGAGSQFDTVRPIRIIPPMSLKDANNFESPVDPLTIEEYRTITNKASTGRPSHYYYDRGWTAGIITFSPIPDASYTVYIDSEKQSANAFSATSENLLGASGFPTEYHPALMYNLAIRLAAPYGVNLRADVVYMANKTLNDLRNLKGSLPMQPSQMQMMV